MRKTDRLYVSEDDCNALMRATAEMLAMPERACRFGNCRRKRRCRRITRTGDAVCVHRLPPAPRAAFEELYEKVILIADDIPDACPAHDPRNARAGRSRHRNHPRHPRPPPTHGAEVRRLARALPQAGVRERESAPFVLADDLDPDDFRSYG